MRSWTRQGLHSTEGGGEGGGYLKVGDSCLEIRRPVDHVASFVDEPLLVQSYECLRHRIWNTSAPFQSDLDYMQPVIGHGVRLCICTCVSFTLVSYAR